MAQLDAMRREQHQARSRANVIVDHGDTEHAPVVVERNPSYYNLVGRVDYRASFGAMETSFEQIQPGSLHRADGGFLILHALDVLRQPFAREALKRALLDREVRIENLADQLSPVPTATLRPEPVALDVKVVLIGPPELYHLLYGLDEDVRDVFKVRPTSRRTWTGARSTSPTVVAASAAGDFHVWAVEHVDEGIELLTGRPAGARDGDGAYPEASVHRLVEDRLHDYALRLRAFGPGSPHGDRGAPAPHRGSRTA
jgi:predicted ATP-dependent protease